MECQYRWGSQVESLDADGGWLIMHPELMTMTKLDDVAAYIWYKLRVACTLEELVSGILDEFDVSRDRAEPEVVDFLHELGRLGLIEQYEHA